MRRLLLLALLAATAAAPASRPRRYGDRSRFISDWLKDYAPAAAPPPLDDDAVRRLTRAALTQTEQRVVYNPDYFKIPYPGGDVPAKYGVCTDVLIRAYRTLGDDLQVDVHEDMAKDFSAYPDLWRRGAPDTNIDHRRVPNLMVYFARHGEALPLSSSPDDYRPGDVVAWDLGGGVTHIGLVVDRRTADGKRWMVVHNIGRGPELEDALFAYKVIGHFRHPGRPAAAAPAVRPHPIVSARRLELTRAYAKAHYGLDTAELKDPRMVVVHATEIGTLKETFAAFAPETMPAERGYLGEHGAVNVGVHFVVDRDGTVYSLLPLGVMGRHAIGFNHLSVGIENVGFSDRLAKEQLEADAALIADLKRRLPGLEFLVGHHEYVEKTRSHYRLYRELDAKYAPTAKTDPGPGFMRDLRAALKARGLTFAD